MTPFSGFLLGLACGLFCATAVGAISAARRMARQWAIDRVRNGERKRIGRVLRARGNCGLAHEIETNNL